VRLFLALNTMYVMSADKQAEIEELNVKLKNSDMQNTILMDAKLGTNNYYAPDAYLRQTLDEQQQYLLNIALKRASSINFLLEYIFSFKNVPDQIGYIYMKTFSKSGKDVLLEILLDDRLASKYRLYALLRLSTAENNPFSIGASFLRFVESQGSFEEEKTEIPKEIEDLLFKESAEILDNASKNKFLTGNSYFDSLEAEMLFTAAAVQLHEKYPDVDLGEFLKQLKYTFVRNGNTEFVVQYTGSDESEYLKIAMGDNKEYIESLKDFVESIYKRNRGEENKGKNKNIQSVAKGRLALIKIVKRSAT
jgi:hypothetical protein